MKKPFIAWDVFPQWLAGQTVCRIVGHKWRSRLFETLCTRCFVVATIDNCPSRDRHGVPMGPNEDLGQCGICHMPIAVLRPYGDSFGWHTPDCSLRMLHAGRCVGGGRGHEVPEGWVVRG